MQEAIFDKLAKTQTKKRPSFRVGDKVTVHVRLKEGDKERIQPFRGVVIKKSPKSGKGIHATFTVRKISEGVGVERLFPINSPAVEKIDVHSSAYVRRSKLYYLRGLRGKKARLKERQEFADLVVPEKAKEEEVVPEITAEAAAELEQKKQADQVSDTAVQKTAAQEGSGAPAEAAKDSGQKDKPAGDSEKK